MESEFHIGEYIAILKRRYIYIIIPFVIVLSGSIAFAVLLPPVYQSTGTILIESPQISSDLVRSTVNSLASERIQIIKQRVMTRSNLFRISEKFDVFKYDNKTYSTTEVVAEMRKKARVELINTAGGGRRGITTIAFKVSFDHKDPLVAVRVANELVTLFLDENVRTRTARASETTEFMAQEASKLEQGLADIENKIAEYEQEYASALPEHLDIRLAMLERSQNALKEMDRDIKTLGDEIRFLDIQLAANRAGFGVNQQNRTQAVALTPKNELLQMQAAFSDLTAVYSLSHPDVIKLSRRIEAVKSGILDRGQPDELNSLLKFLESQLSAARKNNNDSHPDVRKLLAEIESLKDTIASLPDEGEDGENIAKTAVVDPVTATIETKISITNAKIETLQDQKKKLVENIKDIEAKILQTPQVERGLKVLNRDYENARIKYNEIRAKQMEAELSESLETNRKAERFVLLEPPSVPEKPIKPNREKMLAMGFALSLAAGGAGIFLVELVDGSIRGATSLASVINQQPLATIPYLFTMREIRNRKRNKIMIAIIILLLIIGGLMAIHFFYMTLDIVYYKVLSRFESIS